MARDKPFRNSLPTSVSSAPGPHTHAESDVLNLIADLAAKQAGDTDLTVFGGLSPSNDDVLQRKAGAWANRTIAQLKTDLAYGTSSALASDTDGTLAANSDLRVATQKAVKTYADGLLDANNAYQYKGGIDCSANPNYPAASAGHTYKVTVAGKIGGASGVVVEVGDTATCLVDATASGNQATVGANWLVLQTNIDGAVVGPASSVAGDFATFAGATGKVVQDSGVSLDTDATMAANVDTRVPSQKAVKTALALKADDSATVHKTGAETVAGKKTLSSQIALPQISSPAAAAAGTGEIYFKTNGLPYYMNPGGIEVPFNVGDVVSALHTNADFENQTAGVPDTWNLFWQSNGATTSSTSEVVSGTRSALVTLAAAGGNFQDIMSDAFTVAGGDVVQFSVYAKKATGSPKIQLSMLTKASGTPDFFDAGTTTQVNTQVALGAGYTKYIQTFAVPSGHTVARLDIGIRSTASEACTAYLDNTTSSKTVATVADLDWVKRRVKAVATTAVTVAGGAPSTVDGVALAVSDRVLRAVPGGTAADGVYIVTTLGTGANGTWTRVPDMSVASDCAGAEVVASAGTVNGGTRWSTSFKSTDTVGTTPMVWTKDLTDQSTVALTGNLTVGGTIGGTMGNGGVGTGTFRDSVDARIAALAPAVHVGYRSAAANQTLTTATFTTLSLAGTADHDVGSGFTKASDIVTITVAGVYQLSAFCGFNVATGNARNILRIETWTGADPGVGLANQIIGDEKLANLVSFNALNCATQRTFAAGAKVRVTAFQNQGTNNTTSGATLLHQLNIERIS